MLKNGRIETKIFTKSDPIYVRPSFCHDPKLFKSIFKGVGLRIRLNCSPGGLNKRDEIKRKICATYRAKLNTFSVTIF